MARIDAFLKLGTQQGCSDVHLAVGVPPMLRMHGDLLPIKFRDLRDAELEGYITRDPDPHAERAVRQGQRSGLLLRVLRGRALSRQCLPQGHRRRRHLPLHPRRRADAGEAGAAADRHQAVRLSPGHGAGHRLHRHRQVDHARGDDRSPQLDPAAEHHQPRGSDRVRAPEQDEPGHPARARHAYPELRRGRARGDARGPGRDPGR